LKIEYESVINENMKLKEKNKMLKENLGRGGNSTNENFNLSKFIDSLTYMQAKNEELEKENRIVKLENEELNKKLKYMKKMYSDDKYASKNKSNQNKSQTTLRNQNKNKNEMMENLLKQQIMCMKKMINIVQDDKDNTTSTSLTVIIKYYS
jgi:hypothetical protein